MNEQEIREHLSTRTFGRKLLCLETVDSTNNRARALSSSEFDEGTLVIAEYQTAGRGRIGREWHSDRGKNLTFSILLKPKLTIQHLGVLSICAGVAVAAAVEELSTIKPTCKWPNDILLNKKKVCGILSESVFRGESLTGVIIGIGINVNQTAFPEILEDSATSLAIETGRMFDRPLVLCNILKKLEERYEVLNLNSAQSILTEWKQRSAMFGKTITIDQHGKRWEGTALSLDADGGLIVRVNGSERKVVAGDVTILEGNQQ